MRRHQTRESQIRDLERWKLSACVVALLAHKWSGTPQSPLAPYLARCPELEAVQLCIRGLACTTACDCWPRSVSSRARHLCAAGLTLASANRDPRRMTSKRLNTPKHPDHSSATIQSPVTNPRVLRRRSCTTSEPSLLVQLRHLPFAVLLPREMHTRDIRSEKDAFRKCRHA